MMSKVELQGKLFKLLSVIMKNYGKQKKIEGTGKTAGKR